MRYRSDETATEPARHGPGIAPRKPLESTCIHRVTSDQSAHAASFARSVRGRVLHNVPGPAGLLRGGIDLGELQPGQLVDIDTRSDFRVGFELFDHLALSSCVHPPEARELERFP